MNHRRLALSVLAAAAALLLIRLAMPIGFGLFLGALLAFVLQPLYDRLLGRGWRPVPAALVCSVAMSLLLAITVFGLGYLIVSELFRLIQTLPAQLAEGGDLHDFVSRLTTLLRGHHIDPDEQLKSLPGLLAPEAQILAAAVAATSGQVLIFLIMLTMANFNVLLRWRRLVSLAERALPLDPAHTRRLFREFREVGRRVVIGTLVGSLIQGTTGGLVCWVTGVPRPAFFGAVTAFLSPVPVIGSVMVWVSVGVFRIATGHVESGIAELILGATLVGVVMDDIVRPRLVGGGGKFPAVLTFIGLFGGVAVFGLSGLIAGPIVVALCVAVLKIYTLEWQLVPVAPSEASGPEPEPIPQGAAQLP